VGDWFSYSLEDLLPLSRQTYLGLYARYNASHWPMVLLGIVVGAWLWWRLMRGDRGLASALVPLAFGWLWVAWAFLWGCYAPLNWPAGPAAWAFGLQGALLLGWAAVSRSLPSSQVDWHPRRAGAAGILLFAWLGLPLSELLAGRHWAGLGWLGSTPDATALATLAVLAALDSRLRWPLALVPAIWCLYAALSLLAMGDPAWWVTPLAAVLAIGLLVRPRSRTGR
jgi:hypothetical protein